MPESYKDFLVQAKQEAPSAIIEFMQSRTQNTALVAFVEGDGDVRFYLGFLMPQSVDGDLLIIKCHNKVSVLKTQRFIAQRRIVKEYDCILYLCDRDFDDFLNVRLDKEIFVTRYYSIESYLIDVEFFDHILAKQCHVTRRKEREGLARRLFDDIVSSSTNIVEAFAAMCAEREVSGIMNLDDYPLPDLSPLILPYSK